MTPEELLGLPGPIEQMSDADLEAHLAKFFPATRPAVPLKHIEVKGARAMQSVMNNNAPATTSADDILAKQREAMLAAYAKMGLDEHGNLIQKPKRNLNTLK